MCHDPSTLSDGSVVACRNCELCRYNRVKDWAGRNIAQSKISVGSFACTLTYGPELDADRMPIPGRKDHMRMAVLTYSDVQNFLKYLRWLGYEFQYFVTGELGGLYSRVHWHIILHFTNRVPPHELNRRFSDRHVNDEGLLFKHEVCKAWPHGFMMWKKPSFQDVFYNCKYILKDADDEAAQRKPGMSKKPPIGTRYFFDLADRHVQQHLAPQDLKYTFKEVRKDDGSPLEFMLQGRTAELYLERFILRWEEVHGDKPRPKSQLVDLFDQYGKRFTDKEGQLRIDGKIINNEQRMLIREEFPKGESRAVIPTGKQIRAMAEHAKAEWDDLQVALAEARIEGDEFEWQRDWVSEGSDGEERQRRQGIIEWERFERDQEYREYVQCVAEVGWQFIPGKGWVYSGTGPNTARRESFLQWRRNRGHEVAKQPREREQLEPAGPVGKYNRAYGQRPGERSSD